ncbi:acetylornithine aminotransferase, mitochondrial [Amborella trichopoda]|uniref:Uncharacterized protein n=1 Tax=Amborella trichopoda TaxID=13333 RepID=U5CXJ4_AMBTC|nr:acetylornithine aminotransferase, mitochondrial [Amborella trichopoda]ERN14879.1 hypothetical protein AMTR_s00032p00157410 [Amborella trichopoda]|eukprot:XP_006853412.1 acetylornithine aminotransferase, mitochondrial [Amborella trichopoda]
MTSLHAALCNKSLSATLQSSNPNFLSPQLARTTQRNSFQPLNAIFNDFLHRSASSNSKKSLFPLNAVTNNPFSIDGASNPNFLAPETTNPRRTFVPATPSKTSALSELQEKASFDSSDLELGFGKGREIIEIENKYLVRTYERPPVVFVSGKGCRLYDTEGKEYLDMAGGIAVNSIGHSDPDWVKAITEQANTLTHVSNVYYSIPQVMLGKRLVDSCFADRIFFSNSGTEANEAAIKFARKFQRDIRPNDKNPPTEFISYTNSFHGRTMGSLALTSKEHYRSPYEPVMPGVTFLEYGDIEASVKAIRSGKIAAVFVEPVQGEGGIYSAATEFLEALRSACNDAGALLVFDEVQCGLGRTGRLWAHEAYGVKPDMMTLAKPLAGGLPIGATLVTEQVASVMNPADHGSTFAGGPLVCHSALTVLDKIQSPGFLDSVAKKGLYTEGLLRKKLGSNPHLKEIRFAGLLIGVELDVKAQPLVDKCRDEGLLVLTAGKGNIVRLAPPLVISERELEQGVEILCKCFPALDGETH